jgi:AI-2 transport protein TqsA
MDDDSAPLGIRLLLPAACLVVVIAGLKAAQAIMVPVVFAVFLAVLCAPLVLRAMRWRIPPIASIPVVVLGVLGVLAGVGGFVGTSVNEFVSALPRYHARIGALVQTTAWWLEARGANTTAQRVRESTRPQAVIDLFAGALTQVASLATNIVLVILIMIFVLFEVTAMPAKIRAAMGDPEADLSEFTRVTMDVQKYLVVKTCISALTGFLVAISLWVLGVDFAVLWGLVAFVLNYVPNIGSIIAAIPPVMLALIQYGLGRALTVLSVFIAINMVIGNLLEPQVMGRRLGLSTLVVFVSLLAWGWLWGPAGMLLSVPLTMVVKIMAEHSPDWRWLAILMEPSVKAPLPKR